MSDKDKLSAAFRRCPLCGGKPVFNVIFEDGSDVYGNLECVKCGLFLMGADCDSFEDMQVVWNRRKADDWFINLLELSLRKRYRDEKMKAAADADPVKEAQHLGKAEAYKEITETLRGSFGCKEECIAS